MKPHIRASRRTLAIAACALLGLAGCSSPAPSGDAVDIASLDDISGDWDIVSFDGYIPQTINADAERRAFVNISGNRLGYALECNFSGMGAQINEDSRLVALDDGSLNATTAMLCDEDTDRREEAFFSLFTDEPKVERLPNGDVLVSSLDHDLVLRRTEEMRQARLAQTIEAVQGKRKADIIYYSEREGSNRNLLAPINLDGARLDIDGNALTFAYGCTTMTATASISAPGALDVQDATATTSADADCRISAEDRALANQLIQSGAMIETIGNGAIFIRNGKVKAVFHPVS